MQQYQQDWVSKWAMYEPEKIAVKEFESQRTWSYGELDQMGNALAWHLKNEFGIAAGDRIAVLADNSLEYIALFVAAQKSGFILTPLNYRLSSAELNYLLGDADPSLFIFEEKYKNEALSALPLSPLPLWSMETLTSFCLKALENPDKKIFPLVPVDEDAPLFILYTSGTTGFPKGALYTHKMLFWNSINTALRLLINTDTRTINVMPPFHTGGWNVLTTPLLHFGGYTCLMKKFDAPTVLRLLSEEKPTLFMAVPTMLKMMADDPFFDQAQFPDLKYFIVGGEPMPVPLIEIWAAKGVAVRQGYGMTEVGPNLTSLHHNDAIRKKGSIGKPNFYVEIRIADENGRPVAPGENGELWLKGPMTTPGYWKNETATRAAITDGWFHSGDLVRQDEEGYLYVVDRIKNMFISGGENVYPAEIERVLVSHPDIAEAAVISIPDTKWGESGCAFIALHAGKKLDESAVLEYCRLNLAAYKVPKTIIWVENLPKNDTGKIDRKRLKPGH